MVHIIDYNKYSSYYVINEDEYNKLTGIVLNSGYSNPYSAFLIVLLKELKGDVEATLRVLSTGIKSSKKIFPIALYRFLIKAIKEAVVLSNYKDFIEEDGFISVVRMSQTPRFMKMNLDRQTIIRTFKRYHINYNPRNF